MPDILHRVGIKSAPIADVYAALTTLDGLSGWWTTDTKGDVSVGGVMEFRFDLGGEVGGFDMKVLELVEDKYVLWQVVDGPAEWIDTTVSFELKQENDFTVVLFKHEGWAEAVEFMHHCTTKWGTFLMSFKSLLETGSGQAAPDDVKISNWH